jgi:hypothetical protein
VTSLVAEWRQLVANAEKLGLTIGQITAVVDRWVETPYDRDHLWRMLQEEAANVNAAK